ncbi:MAG: response regulator [Alphaproteobacteria bacterium]|nr:response regulator [Alphaproteobacteria bacterium]
MENNKSIYIIEDNTALQQIYSISFKKNGWEVYQSFDGLQALTEIFDVHPTVVLLDLMMPELDGFEFLETLKKNTSTPLFIVVNSNLTSEQDIQKAKMLGAHTYLKKSEYTGDQLVEKIESILKTRRS